MRLRAGCRESMKGMAVAKVDDYDITSAALRLMKDIPPKQEGECYSRSFIFRSAAICLPWKRPFSIKISFVREPATITPAT